MRLTPKAHALAWRMMGNRFEAEDVLQDAFFKLFKMTKPAGQASLSACLHTILAGLCMERLQRREPELVGLDLDQEQQAHLAHQPGEEELALQSEPLSEIQTAFQQLPPRQRLALGLWAYQYASVGDMAEILEIDSNTALQLLNRAKSSFNNCFRSRVMDEGDQQLRHLLLQDPPPKIGINFTDRTVARLRSIKKAGSSWFFDRRFAAPRLLLLICCAAMAAWYASPYLLLK